MGGAPSLRIRPSGGALYSLALEKSFWGEAPSLCAAIERRGRRRPQGDRIDGALNETKQRLARTLLRSEDCHIEVSTGLYVANQTKISWRHVYARLAEPLPRERAAGDAA